MEDETIAARETRRAAKSPNLGSVNSVLFEELENLLSLDVSDSESMEAEISRARAVGQLCSTAIDNANTALRVMQVKDGLMDAKARLPRMLTAGE